MRLAARPITTWPGKLRTERERIRDPFDVKWNKLLNDLGREVAHIDRHGDEAVALVEFAITEADIRLDGWIYASTTLTHPGVIVKIDSSHGPIKLWTDRFHDWRGNLRAVSLYLAHQRAAERYGLGRGDEAFMGWKELGPGIALGPATPQTMTYEMAINFIATCTGADPANVAQYVNAHFRKAAAKFHPDNKETGNANTFKRLVEARDLIYATQEAS